jgi:hypothetical protein
MEALATKWQAEVFCAAQNAKKSAHFFKKCADSYLFLIPPAKSLPYTAWQRSSYRLRCPP